MVEDKKDEDLKDKLIAQLLERSMAKGNAGSGISPNIAALLAMAKENKENKGTVDPMVAMMIMRQSEEKGGMNDIMQMMMTYKMLTEMMKPPEPKEDDILKMVKLQAVMGMMGNQKSTSFEDMIKLMTALKPQSQTGPDPTLQFIEKWTEQQDLKEQHKKELEEQKDKTAESMKGLENKTAESMKGLEDKILDLAAQLNAPQRNNTFADQLKQTVELQKDVKNFAQQMGWGPGEGLPASKEEWEPEHYLKAIEQIGGIASKIVGGFSSTAQLRAPKKDEIIEKAAPAPVEQPAKTPTAPAAPAPSQPAKPATVEQPAIKLDPELEDYISSMKKTDKGILDKYGSLFSPEGGGDVSLADMRNYALQDPASIKTMMTASKKDYEEVMQKQAEAQAPPKKTDLPPPPIMQEQTREPAAPAEPVTEEKKEENTEAQPKEE